MTQWSGFLFFPFGFHLLLLELHMKRPPGRALALHPHIGDAVAWAARGCTGFSGTVPSLSLAQLLHWGPGSCKSFCFGLDSVHSEAVSYLLFHISKRPWFWGFPHSVVRLTPESFNPADYRCCQQPASGTLPSAGHPWDTVAFALRNIKVVPPGYCLLLWCHA